MRYPTKSPQGAGTSNPADTDEYSYDANSNVTSRKLRGTPATSIAFTYDNLNRVTAKNLPGSEPDVSYTYDNLGRLTGASQSGNSLSFSYDALSRNLTQASPRGILASQYDLGSRRTRLTHPDGFFVDQDYLVTGELTKVRENGASSGIAVLATFAYDNLGRIVSLTRGNGAVTSYTFDPVSRLATLTDNPTNTTHDQTVTFGYNPSSQIASLSKTNTLFAWTQHGSGTTASTANGLNQLVTVGPATITHDMKGNLTGDGTRTFGYSSENLLTSANGPVTLAYDPLMRLDKITAASTTGFAYDGLDLIAEYDAAGVPTKRYVHGPAWDQPLVEYDGSTTTTKRWLHSDERGSVVALSNTSGVVTTVNRYDEYGKPQSSNAGRFQYTGQTWLNEIGVYYYKTRMYDPIDGRFLQTDTIGFAGGTNLYPYVGNDPVNFVDPLGLKAVRVCDANGCGWVDDQTGDILVTGERYQTDFPPAQLNFGDFIGIPILALDSLEMAFGDGGGGSENYPGQETEETEEENKRDLAICRSLSDPGAQSRCFQSANRRDHQRRWGKPVEELETRRDISPVPVVPLPSPGCLRLRHPILIGACVIITG